MLWHNRKVKVLRISILSLILLSLVGCETVEPAKTVEPTYRGASFEVVLPPAVETSSEQGDGYAVHYFRVPGSKSSLGIYEGQRPNLFSNHEKDLTVMKKGTTFRNNIDRGDDSWGIDSNGKIWRESVWN